MFTVYGNFSLDSFQQDSGAGC